MQVPRTTSLARVRSELQTRLHTGSKEVRLYHVRGNVTTLVATDADLKAVLASGFLEMHVSVGSEVFEHIVDITPR